MSEHESEAQTRRKRIDPQLKAVAWETVPFVEDLPTGSLTHHAVEEFETANGPPIMLCSSMVRSSESSKRRKSREGLRAS